MAENIPITLLSATADEVGGGTNTLGGIYQVISEDTAGTGDADYGGGTITLQTSLRGGGWQDVFDSSGALLEINAANDYASTLRINTSMQIRATLAGATSPDVKVSLV